LKRSSINPPPFWDAPNRHPEDQRSTDEATIRDGKIAIAVVAALKDSTVVNLSLENKKEYAQKHGYDVIAIDELGSFSRKPAWAKIPLLFSLLSSASMTTFGPWI
jgi:hypothetical protein